MYDIWFMFLFIWDNCLFTIHNMYLSYTDTVYMTIRDCELWKSVRTFHSIPLEQNGGYMYLSYDNDLLLNNCFAPVLVAL